MPSPNTHSSPRAGPFRTRRWWPWVKNLLYVLFLGVVTWLLVSQARQVDWEAVSGAVRRRPATELLAAAACAAASFGLYSCFDLLGRYLTGHALSARKVMTVNFISYAFNLNLGALIGGLAFRYRLYSRLGLEIGVITRVVFVSMLTNWLGYIFLAGLVFWWRPPALPSEWAFGSSSLQALGIALLAAAILYPGLCLAMRRRRWSIYGHDFTLPSLRLSLLQLAMSSVNWLLMASAMYLLLDQTIAFSTVLAVLLVAAMAGVLTHVPAGLGVLETVFVVLLSHLLPPAEILASLLLYRAIYYFLPLIVAALTYLFVETRAKRNDGRN